MAASAYAFLVSLLNTMDQIQIHPRLSTCFDKCQNESLREKVDCLVDFVENDSDAVVGKRVGFLVDADSIEAEVLLSRIAVVAQLAEDIIEVEAAHQILDGSTDKSPIFLNNLQKVIQDMDCIIKQEVNKLERERKLKDEQSTSTTSMAPPSSSTAKTTNMVGFDGYMDQLLDELTGHHSSRRILLIVGMGGIGKTTLARNVYGNLLTVEHFYVRVWVTVSQAFSLRDILLQALSCLGGWSGDLDKTDDEVGEELYKILSGRRYLAVLDDVWSIEAWESIRFFFPENGNRSRIVVTTRQQQLLRYFASSSALALDFLDDDNSWELFCDKTFAKQGCPLELEEIGRKIVKKCKGLPLAITVIGGLLGKSPRTREYWEKIAEDKRLVVENSGEVNKALSLLYLSYKHLPVWLKPCFLYLGLFPEDYRIQVSLLIRFWIAEGCIKPKTDQSLEEIAESYIKDLVDRNLLIVGDLRLNKKFRTCSVHDLVRELCVRIADKENFYCVQRDIAGTRQFIVDERTASLYPLKSLTSETPSVMRPLIFEGHREAPLKSRLLRVLAGDIRSLDPTFQQVNLHFFFQKPTFSFVALRTYKLPSSISLCWRLQTLVFDLSCLVVVPSEIWKMSQLRHIVMWPMHLPDPPPSKDSVLQNLQTLERVHNLNFSEEVCKRIPNIKKLRVEYDLNEHCHLQKVGCLNKLESLNYSCKGKEYRIVDPLHNLKLPSSLKELYLRNCRLAWSDMAAIASLPHLEILQFRWKAVVGPEWNCVEEEFVSLKHLVIDSCNDLIHWTANRCSFPVLEKLSLGSLSKLDEIPSEIGEIPTLEKISVAYCSESAMISAVKILEEQESLGNEGLQLQLSFFKESEAKMWRERIRELGFTCQNLRISSGLG